jgi:hypothetical protein
VKKISQTIKENTLCPICKKYEIYKDNGDEIICGDCDGMKERMFFCRDCNKIIFLKELIITPNGVEFPCCKKPFTYESHKSDDRDQKEIIMENQIKYIKTIFDEIIAEIKYPPFETSHTGEMDYIFQKFIQTFDGDWINEGKEFKPEEEKEWYKSENLRLYNIPREHFTNNEIYMQCNCRGFFRFLGHGEPNGESTIYKCNTCGTKSYIM